MIGDNRRIEFSGAMPMRGEVEPQAALFSYFSPEAKIPAEHLLRSIKACADAALGAISGEVDTLPEKRLALAARLYRRSAVSSAG